MWEVDAHILGAVKALVKYQTAVWVCLQIGHMEDLSFSTSLGHCFCFMLWFVVSLFLCLPFGAFCIFHVYFVCHFQALLIYLLIFLSDKKTLMYHRVSAFDGPI